MKKIGVFLLVTVMICTFAGCISANADYEKQISNLNGKIATLEMENNSLTATNKNLEAENGLLKSRLSVYEPVEEENSESSDLPEISAGQNAKEIWIGSEVFYCLPIECTGNNKLYSDDSFEIDNFTFVENRDMEGGNVLTYTGKFRSKDDYAYQEVGLTFALIDKKEQINTRVSAGMASVFDVRMGDEKDFTVDVYVTDYELENAQYICLTAIVPF